MISSNTSPERRPAVEKFKKTDFCKESGLLPSDGTQIRNGSCSSLPQGAIPSVDNMISSIIVEPENGGTVDGSKNITVTTIYDNLDTGFFSDPQTAYYKIPQTLNADGKIQGHSHITVQGLGSADQPPSAKIFSFFQGLNSRADDGRTLSVAIPANTIKTNGLYRICSLSAANSHQPTIMPVAQRGAQDDCIRVTIKNCENSDA
ncbi:hypothetical protein DFS34DRAFT_580891 [Phlyctochytrium arcticum]|nr:hypothetical protein DFS34DRAFT_580891 [Phlyctochytrium arcticum]